MTEEDSSTQKTIKEIVRKRKKYFLCNICDFAYKDVEDAKKCEVACKDYEKNWSL